MMGVKSRLPVSKEKLLRPPLASASQPQQASLKHRHSSPIKEPTKNISKEVKDVHLQPQFQPQPLSRPASQAQVLPSSVQAEAAVASTASMAQPQKVATASAAFPIEASRVNLNWISIPINSAAAKTEVIALKNSKSALVRVVMQIKDCSEVG